MKLTLGDRYTDNMDQIYKLTIKFVIETVVKGYEMAAEREVNENVQKLNSISERPMYYGTGSGASTSEAITIDHTVTSGQMSTSGGCPVSLSTTCPGVCPHIPSSSNTTATTTPGCPAKFPAGGSCPIAMPTQTPPVRTADVQVSLGHSKHTG